MRGRLIETVMTTIPIGLRVAREIVRARVAAKMTQRELARALKTNLGTISRIESDAGSVTIKTLGRIARALNCRLDIRIVSAARRVLPGIST